MRARHFANTPARVRRSGLACLLLSLVLLAACGGDDDSPPPPTRTATLAPTHTAPPSTSTPMPSTPTLTSTRTSTAEPAQTSTQTPPSTATNTPVVFGAHGSVGQVWVIDATPGAAVELRRSGTAVASGVADTQGSFLFRNVEPGAEYAVAVGSGASEEVSESVTVTRADEPPPASFYESQSVVAGYQYITTRDGTKLAINVLLPGPISGGPYPTVIEYSGYDPANPSDPEPSTRIANALGYAAVGINIRGSGCSGGAFDFFETLQSTDGYDAIEIIAAQPWVKGHKVGMVGISYPGISQLFVAQLRPPHLAAIAPLSVIADIGAGILYPGGILNDGFAVTFANDRQHDAMPGGQPWSQARIDQGDQTCIANQKVRFQSADLMQRILENPYYVESVAGSLSPSTFVDRIDVPVFLAGAWQDEQTGGYFANMISHFTTPKAHFTVVNGNHIEPLGPSIFGRWLEFLDLYVAERKPARAGVVPLILGVLNDSTFQVPGGLTLEPERFTEVETYEEALALYEAEPRVRVLFESGGGGSPGAPIPTFEAGFASWPIPSLEPTAFYFAEGGALSASLPEAEGSDSFTYDPSGSQRTNYDGPFEEVWRASVNWDWERVGADESLAYASAPLAEPLVLAGSASVDLWLEASAADVDLQATLSEITPDGNEVYVQTGWLRASHRKIDPLRSSETRPVQTHLEADAEELPAGELVLARIEVYPFAHVFHTGSRIRVLIAAPGGDRAAWKFDALAALGGVEVQVSRSPGTPSRLVLPVIPGIDPPAAVPACNALRGQPCRPYVE